MSKVTDRAVRGGEMVAPNDESVMKKQSASNYLFSFITKAISLPTFVRPSNNVGLMLQFVLYISDNFYNAGY